MESCGVSSATVIASVLRIAGVEIVFLADKLPKKFVEFWRVGVWTDAQCDGLA